MLPEEEGVGQHGAGLDPDDLLVDEQTGPGPGLLHESLPAVSMPLVYGRMGREMRQTRGDELEVRKSTDDSGSWYWSQFLSRLGSPRFDLLAGWFPPE